MDSQHNSSFLTQLADKIAAVNPSLWKDMLIVLPNLRAQRMLLTHLAVRMDKPAFAPTVISINDFIESLSPLKILDKVALIGRLYETYNHVQQTHFATAADFNDMMTWASSFLGDIEDIDVQLADGQSLFADLYSAKDFELRFGKDGITEKIQKQIDFYQTLGDIYTCFTASLLENKQGYSGLIYRDCANHIEEYASRIKMKTFIFAGFHVFTPAELKIVEYIKNHYQTDFYFDIDPFYCDFQKEDSFSTAYFIKQICNRLSLSQENLHFVNKDYETKEKEVQIVGVAKSMNQIYYAIDQLNHLEKAQGNLDNTALVLADEQLLMPFCAAYDCDKANITMGFRLADTPAYRLLIDLLDCYRPEADGAPVISAFRHRDMMALLRHPLVWQAFLNKDINSTAAVAELDAGNLATITEDDLQKLPKACYPDFLQSPTAFFDNIMTYLKRVMGHLPETMHEAYLPVLLEQLRQMDADILSYIRSGNLNYTSIRTLMIMQLEGLSITKTGDPMHGLQIMGLLETRTLDFENVIMLSVNEGILPSGIDFTSLIPFEFKFDGSNLEKYLYKDQVYAYHFFRLLQRAHKIVLIYDNDSSNKVAEKSRFIRQLEFEVTANRLSNIKFSYPSATIPFVFSSQSIEIKKTDDIMKALQDFSFSASSLNTFLSCPLQFYYNYICKIRPIDRYEDKIGADVIGSAVHDAFQVVFTAIQKNREHYTEIMDHYLSQIETLVKESLVRQNFTESDLKQGRVYLAQQIIKKQVSSYLVEAKKELADPNLVLIEFEKEMCHSLTIRDKIVKLKGVIDRVQSRRGVIEILDYKTGSVNPDKIKILDKNEDWASAIENVFCDSTYDKLFQLLFYAFLFRGDQKTLNCRCGIISLMRCVSKEPYILQVSYGINKKSADDLLNMDVLDAFEGRLQELLSEIFDIDSPFIQNPDANACRYCNFIHICGRQVPPSAY